MDAPPEPALVTRLGEGLGVGHALAALLVRRGLTDPEDARRFLRPELTQLADPLGLAGMAGAVEAIRRAVHDGTGILVHGDYDVDGQCATAVLTRALRAAGARVTPFVPHRLRDGYDLGTAGIEAAVAAGAGLILTFVVGFMRISPRSGFLLVAMVQAAIGWFAPLEWKDGWMRWLFGATGLDDIWAQAGLSPPFQQHGILGGLSVQDLLVCAAAAAVAQAVHNMTVNQAARDAAKG